MRSQPRYRGTAPVSSLRLLGVAVALYAIGACDGSHPLQPRESPSRPEASVNAQGTPFPIEFFVQAHQDDWQLFLGDRAAGAVPTAGKIVFVYTTAGDAGTSNAAGYWQARERAVQASVDSMTPSGAWTCANQTINAHVIQRCVKGSVVSYYMRLPDGNGDGQGYSPLFASLGRLRSGAIASLSAKDGSTTYTSWTDLVSTFQSLVSFEAGSVTDPALAMHAPEYLLSANDGDHLDHITTGELVRAAGVTRPWNFFWYVGYPNLYQPINLTPAQQALKWKLIVAYDNVLKGDWGTIVGTSHAEEWSKRTIFRTEWTVGQPPPPPTTVPASPTALQAAPNGARIDLTWSDNSTDEGGFRIERAPDVSGVAGTYVEVATVGSNVTAYSSTDVVGNTRYWFRVRAFNVVGNSGYTNETSAIILPPPPPAAPSALVAAPFSAARIDLTWTDNATNESGYRVERAPDAAGVAGAYTEIATVGPNVTVFSNVGLLSNTRYWYRVRAYDALQSSAYSNETSATTPLPPPSTFPVEIYLNAHQDDWQLFFGNRTAASVQTAAKVVIVYTTAGDAGSPGTGYWTAREAGANASVDSMTVAGGWTCGTQTYNAHPIWRCTKANTVSYYLRLPDGNGDGLGYGSGSLELLESGSVASLSAKNGSTTYTSWADLVTTVRTLVESETAGQADANVGVHVTDWSSANVGDHPDHMNTGELVKAASVNHAWNLFWYIGYPTVNMPVNLGPAEEAIKWRLIVAYDDVLKANYGTIIGTSHAEDWAKRTIYRSTSGLVPSPAAPITPSNLAAANYQGTRIDVTWQDNASDEQGYRIERAPDLGGAAGTYAQIASVAANVATYSNSGLVINTRYWYRVRAYNANGNSAYSNESSAIMAIPPAPSALVATPNSGVRIDISWTDNSGNEEQGFRVESAPDVGGIPGTYTQIASVAANVRTYSNTGLTLGTRYWYRVRAYNAIGTSAYSNETSATTLSGPIAPSALTATAVSGVRINLAWTDNSTNETGFRVERAPDVGGVPGAYVLLTSPTANVQSYNNNGLANGTRYWYRVRAYNSVGNSAYTNEANATTFALPLAPTNVQGVAASSVVIDVSWTDNATDETSYRLERAPDVAGAPGNFGSAVTLGANVTTYRSTGLAANTIYWYRVRAQNSVGNSAFATPVRVTTLPFAPPSGLTANAYLVGTTRNVDLRWTRGSELTVDIYRNGTRIVSARGNDGGPYNNQPAASLGATVSYQVCAAGKTGAANCSAVVNANF